MKDDWTAIKPFFLELAFFIVLFAIFGTLILTNHSSQLIPTPEKTAEEFVGAVAAQRYHGAMEELRQDLQQQVDESDLKKIHDAIQSSQQGIEEAHGESSDEQGDTATAKVKVKLGNLQEEEITFPLQKEKGVWKLTSIDPLRSLASSAQLLLP